MNTGCFFQVWKTTASSSPDALKGSPALLGEGSGCFGQAVEEAGEVGSIREEKVTGAKKEMTRMQIPGWSKSRTAFLRLPWWTSG